MLVTFLDVNIYEGSVYITSVTICKKNKSDIKKWFVRLFNKFISFRFFPNEVMRVPLYEAVPVELVISHCWVMDLNTFCKGRPIGAPEEHIYICEYRVDKSARLFSKVSKSKFPICTKTFVFERFETRLKISRTYTPHDLDPAMIKPRGRKPQENEDTREPVIPPMSVHVPVIRVSILVLS